MSMTATARPVDGTLRHDVDVNGRHTIVTDEPTRLGGTDAGPAPHELLPAMLAGCVSTMIMTYANARGLELGELRVDVDYDPESTPRHVGLVVRVPAGLAPDQAERLRRIADTCPSQARARSGVHLRRRDRRSMVIRPPTFELASVNGAPATGARAS